MPVTFKFLHDDKTVEAGFRRIALEQIEKALDQLHSDESSDKVIHGVRRRCKRLRGLIRLVRPSFPGYAIENAAIRDAAAGLSHFRDALVMLETYDSLWKHTSLRPSKVARQWLADHGANQAGQRNVLQALEECEAQLSGVGRRIQGWQLCADSFEAIGGGLKQVYSAKRAAMRKAGRQPSAVNFHEWRKVAKYHLHHLELMRASAPEIVSGFRDCASKLADALGDHHNLDLLAVAFKDAGEIPDLKDDIEAISSAITHQTRELEHQAFELGGELSAERPRAFVDRYAQYWEDWRG
ncbi:MAG TPA: CHAD domain-containing protein [Arsenicitalea sp.]|nr:CHAD domain-containing protein [Arsenicitalea sp.]